MSMRPVGVSLGTPPNKSTGDDVKLQDEYWNEFIPAMLPTRWVGATDGDPQLAAAWLGWQERRKIDDAALLAVEASAAKANARAEASEAELARTKRWIHDHEKLFAADALQAQVDALRKERDDARQLLGVYRVQREAAEAENKEYRSEVDALQAQVDALTKEVESLTKSLDANWVMHQRVVAADARCERLLEQVTELRARNDTLKAIAEQALADGSATNRGGEHGK